MVGGSGTQIGSGTLYPFPSIMSKKDPIQGHTMGTPYQKSRAEEASCVGGETFTISTVASQQEGPGFESRSGRFCVVFV